MSVAASLAALRREGQSIPRNAPNVQLTQLPATSSLSERAAAARNALTLLSTADPSLSVFEQELHLLDTSFDRATLSPDSHRALSLSVSRLALRLTPVFLTRPCATLLEWLLQTLQLSIHGSTEEIDSLMLCALPFHHTERFLTVARALLRSSNSRKWRWLAKRVKDGRLVDAQFCVERAPSHIFKSIISKALQCVKEGVAVAPLAGLMTNLVGRRLASDDLPVLSVLCIDTLLSLRRASKAAEQLLCSLFTVLATAVSHGIEPKIARAIASAAVYFLTRSDISSSTKTTIIALLALCLRRHENCLSSKDARTLLKTGNFPASLLCLGPRQSVDTYRDIIRNAIVFGTPSEKLLRIVGKALAVDQLLSPQSVSELIEALLKSCESDSANETDERFAKERTPLLASMLTTLFKGSFSDAVDDVLHRYLVSRKGDMKRKKASCNVSAALSSALDTIISRNSEDEVSDGVSGSHLLAVDILCLSHPDKSKKRCALENISGRDLAAERNNKIALRRLCDRLYSIIKKEDDLRLVTSALEILTRMPVRMISRDLIKATFTQCISEKSEGQKPNNQRDQLVVSLLGICEKISTEQPVIAPAVLLLLSYEGLLERCSQTEDGREWIQRLRRRFGAMNGSTSERSGRGTSSMESDVVEDITELIFDETYQFRDLLSAVADINEQWIGKLSMAWLKLLWAKFSESSSAEELRTVSKKMLNLIHLYHKLEGELVRTFEADIKCVLGASKDRNIKAVEVWNFASELTSWQTQEEILKSLIKPMGLSQTIVLLRDGCFDLKRSDEARKRSLEWYINFCIVHPGKDVGKEAVDTTARIAYGDDSTLRKALDEIWSRRSVLNRKKREKSCMLWDFLQLLYALPEETFSSGLVHPHANALQVEMRERAQELISGKTFLRTSLQGASFGTPYRRTVVKHLASKLLNQEQIGDDNLYLLRAIGERTFADSDDRIKLFSLLQSTLRTCTGLPYSRSAVESVYRLTMLILNSGMPTDTKIDVRGVAKASLSAYTVLLDPEAESSNSTMAAVLLCLMAFITSFTVPKTFPEKNLIVELILAETILPTSIGACARRISKVMIGQSLSSDRLLHYLMNLPGTRSRRSKASRSMVVSTGKKEADVSTKAALGAVRVIGNWIGGKNVDTEKVKITWLLSSVNELWKYIKTAQEEHGVALDGSERFHSESLAAALNTLAVLHRVICKRDIAKGRKAAMEADIDALVSLAFSQESVNAVTDPSLTEVRSAAHILVEVLISSQKSGAKHILPKLLHAQTFAREEALVTKLLEQVVPALLSNENDMKEVIQIVADAAYSEKSAFPRDNRMKIMRTLLSGKGSADAGVDVTKECLAEIYNREVQVCSTSAAAKESSLFLQDAALSCEEDIDCMIYMEREAACHITNEHFVNAGFLAKLGSLTDDGDARRVLSVDEGLSKLFLVLLGLPESAEKGHAVRMLLASAPVSVLQACACATLKSESLELRIESMLYLAERMDTSSLPLFPTWQSISDESAVGAHVRREVGARFLEVVGNELCKNIQRSGTSPAEIELREVATDALKSFAQRLGSSSYTVVQEFASQVSGLTSEDSDVIQSLKNEPAKALTLRGKVLECLACFTSTLGKFSLPFIPFLLDSSFAVLERFCRTGHRAPPLPRSKTSDPSVYITAASVKALTAVLTTCPMFFGAKALKRLVLLALRTEIEAPRELLRELAASQVPVDVFVSVFGSLLINGDALKRAPVEGLLGLAESAASGVSRMYKSEVKVNWQKLLNVLLGSMDCARDISVLLDSTQSVEKDFGSRISRRNETVSLGNSHLEWNESRWEKCVQLDSACADVLVKIVLKLSESEFGAVFKALVQWLDGGSLPDAAITVCEDHGAEVEKNLTRALAFIAMMDKLMDVLQAIMIPYAVQLITRLTTIIGRKIPKNATVEHNSSDVAEVRSGKRSRAARDDGEVFSLLVSQQFYLREACIKLIGSFFNLDIGASTLNMRLVGELQGAFLSAFDDLEGQSATMSRAMKGLAKRIMFPGVTDDTKKNQDMLIGLVREVLLRTRDPNPRLRAGALNTCREMAVAVGDEFLATLPESMPILAEVIDDEESTVAKAAEGYILFLESVAGEPILEQLK